jgi:hypothetical protein
MTTLAKRATPAQAKIKLRAIDKLQRELGNERP